MLVESCSPSASIACSISAPATATRSRSCSRRGPDATGVGVDFQEEMLRRAARAVRGRRPASRFVAHDLDDAAARRPRPTSTLVVSSFAIHHLVPDRQRALYGEVFERLAPGGRVRERRARRLANARLARGVPLCDWENAGHRRSVEQARPRVPAPRLARRPGLRDAECVWKWRELAVVTGTT